MHPNIRYEEIYFRFFPHLANISYFINSDIVSTNLRMYLQAFKDPVNHNKRTPTQFRIHVLANPGESFSCWAETFFQYCSSVVLHSEPFKIFRIPTTLIAFVVGSLSRWPNIASNTSIIPTGIKSQTRKQCSQNT
jgi:hypothetical protein